MRREKDYPENHAARERDNARMMEGVYAGPDYFARQNLQMFQTAYAGPAVPNPAGMGIAMAPSADIKPRKFCVSCGAQIDKTAKFCTECGTPQPRDDA